MCVYISFLFQVTITPRMLLSHLSGIRHYEKDFNKIKAGKAKANEPLRKPVKEEDEMEKHKEQATTEHCHKGKDSAQAQKKKEFEHEEYYLKENFESVTQALNLFKDDPLVFEPGKGKKKKKVVKFSTLLLFKKKKNPLTERLFFNSQGARFSTPPTPSRCSVPS